MEERRSVFLTAPSGFGKTEEAKKLQATLGLSYIQEDWVPELVFRTYNTLVITHETVSKMNFPGFQIFTLAQARKLIKGGLV